MTERCPICARPAGALHRPFCSARCADIDLGRWLTAQYVVPGVEGEAELDDAATRTLDPRRPVE